VWLVAAARSYYEYTRVLSVSGVVVQWLRLWPGVPEIQGSNPCGPTITVLRGPRSEQLPKTGPRAILAPSSDIRVRTRNPRSKRVLELQRGSRASNVVVLLRIRTTTFQSARQAQRKTVGDRGRSVLRLWRVNTGV
jgi:hypothetical protein